MFNTPEEKNQSQASHQAGQAFGKRVFVFGLVLYAALAHCTAQVCIEAGEELTEQTLSFFRACKSNLQTAKCSTTSYRRILATQPRSVKITVSQDTMAALPEQIAPGIEFAQVIIEFLMYCIPNPVDQAHLGQVFKAFGTLCAEEIMFAYTNARIGAPLPLPLSQNPGTHPSATLKLQGLVSLSFLDVPQNMLAYIFAHFDAKDCDVVLDIWAASDMISLDLLDGFEANTIVELAIRGMPGFVDLNCQLLCDGLVRDSLRLQIVSSSATVSSTTLAGIYSKEWSSLCVPEALWCLMAEACESSTRVNKLTIELSPLVSVGHILNIQDKHAPNTPANYVKHLEIVYGSLNPSQIDENGLGRLLAWIAASFSDLASITIQVYCTPATEAYLKKTCFFMDMPSLKTLELGVPKCSLYKPDSLLFLPATILKECLDPTHSLSPPNKTLLHQLRQIAPITLKASAQALESLHCSQCTAQFARVLEKPGHTPAFACFSEEGALVLCDACVEKTPELQMRPVCIVKKTPSQAYSFTFRGGRIHLDIYTKKQPDR
ncbi:hypothetical protein NEDG_01784 [Nematocida displodere]|uniref:Uncharacterized protein n=1 Tax=Nematocida displodere TaxID=1805483 RepID=A0A177EHV8_9MICR|nr:hypothetical protein NEDG_01784 [Nematocida displodere]